jgi:2-polyprenyl-3-methyl-5-hydroxy-6-metoxy-1,4-benzoquinol methylase
MKIYIDKLNDISRYIENNKHLKLEDKEHDWEFIFDRIKKFKTINQKTKILEVGTGIGWLPILCKKKGISCRGIEISPQLIEYAQNLGKKYGIEPDIELGNIEEMDIGKSEYDIVIATSTFEHVQHWQKGLKKVFDGLKSGGLFYFYSTNKFSLISGEYHFPLYGWLPNKCRYYLRIAAQGKDIMKLGIDFNQFTYPQLGRFFKNLGFSTVLDMVEVGSHNLTYSKKWKKTIVKILYRCKILKYLTLPFVPGTLFICIK